MSELSLDLSNMTAGGDSGAGITEDGLERLLPRLREAHATLWRESDEGTLGFMKLPGADTAPVAELAGEVVERGCEDFVVLGIGGSSLGARALTEALLHPSWNHRTLQQRGGRPRVFVMENIDPRSFSALLETIDLKRAVFNVVSKSGRTAETVSQLLIVKELLEGEIGSEWAQHIVITTDPERGPLREIAGVHSIASLPVPPDVGGRFSVLSPVGLFPAAVAGIDVGGVKRGASEMDAYCRDGDMARNIASALVSYYLGSYELGKKITVLMPYSDRLRAFGQWFAQLWAESLGKRRNGECAGLTPALALGATDQHSQLQLYLDGPDDKTVTFLKVDDHGHKLGIPPSLRHDEFSFLYGSTLNELLRAEYEATREALRRNGRSSVTITLSSVCPETLGALMYLYEVVAVLMGYMLDINPFDQPAVEEGKKIARGILEGEVSLEPQTARKIECVLG